VLQYLSGAVVSIRRVFVELKNMVTEFYDDDWCENARRNVKRG